MAQIFLVSILMVMGSVATAQTSLIDKIDKNFNDRTDILAIYQHGELVYEEYRRGYQASQKHRIWSMSKSITSLMVARAVQDGRLDISESICKYVPANALPNSELCNLTIDDLLFWRSGTQWSEIYIGLNLENSSVLEGLYGEGIKDFSKYYFSLPYRSELHSNGWNYSTGDSHMLSYILKKVYSAEEYEALPWTLIFDPLGISDVTFERDWTGTYLGGSYLFMNHGDLNKVAQLLLTEYKQPALLPQNWLPSVLTAKTESKYSNKMAEDGVAPAIPGGHWWLNQASNPDIQEIPWPDVPADAFAAFGVFGQMMFVIPSQDLVIIRLAQDVRNGFDRRNLLKTVFAFLDTKDATPTTLLPWEPTLDSEPVPDRSSSTYLLTRFIAKEYCSCRFVIQQSAKVCKDETKATSLLFKVHEDPDKKTIRVTNLAEKAEAQFLNERHGCQLF